MDDTIFEYFEDFCGRYTYLDPALRNDILNMIREVYWEGVMDGGMDEDIFEESLERLSGAND
jgi:hypothetical protein